MTVSLCASLFLLRGKEKFFFKIGNIKIKEKGQ